MKRYIRDSRSPIPKNKNVSRVMSANKAKDTLPEIQLRKELWSHGKRGFRLHVHLAGTRPDIVFTKSKIAIFVNGCFWHRCPTCKLPYPKNNVAFWKAKFRANKVRDLNKTKSLTGAGWTVHTIWECEIKQNIKKATLRLKI